MCKAMQRSDFEAVPHTSESSTGGALEIVASATFGLHGLICIGTGTIRRSRMRTVTSQPSHVD
jgi:hypothetical protein